MAATKRVNGITIAIKADTNGVTSGLKELTDQSVALSKQLKAVDSLLKMDPSDTESLTLKQELLAKSVETTKKRLEALKSAQEDVKAAFSRGDIGTDEYIAFQRELVATEKRMKDLESQSGDTGEAVDDLGSETKETGDQMQKAVKQSGSLGESLKSGLAAGAKAAGAALAVVGAASVKLVKDVIEETGELEQNLGGAESVFGEYADRMKKAGEDAYKNLGLSQSEYLATANKMGALLQGTGFAAEESADITEKAMRRAADMASVMGIDMSAAMESVAGAAKGNFTMMDNLGVAINDTTLKAYAMENGLGEIETTQDKVNVAMQLFLDKTKQYDGNFAKEATQTISGSFGLLSASWHSLIAGLGNSEADISALANNVVDAFDSVVENVSPVVDSIVESLPAVIDSLLDAVERLLPKLIPAFTSIFLKLVDTLVRLLPELTPVAADAIMTITTSLIANAPKILQAALQIITTLAQGIADSLPDLIPVAIQSIMTIAKTLTDPQNLMPLINAAFDIITALINGLLSEESLNAMIDALPEIVENIVDILIDSIDLLLDAAVKIIEALCDYFFEPENLAKIIDATLKIIVKIVEGIIEAVWKIGKAAYEIIDKLVGTLSECWDQLKQAGRDILDSIMDGVVEKWNDWVSWWENIGGYIYDKLHPGDDGADFPTGGTVPAMAVGGIVTAPTRALIGENGAEVILPLENNTHWMDILAAKISGAGGAGVTIGEINVTVSDANSVGIGQRIVEQIDIALRDYQIQQARGYGGSGIG